MLIKLKSCFINVHSLSNFPTFHDIKRQENPLKLDPWRKEQEPSSEQLYTAEKMNRGNKRNWTLIWYIDIVHCAGLHSSSSNFRHIKSKFSLLSEEETTRVPLFKPSKIKDIDAYVETRKIVAKTSTLPSFMLPVEENYPIRYNTTKDNI